jgi:hypothetical protein
MDAHGKYLYDEIFIVFRCNLNEFGGFSSIV